MKEDENGKYEECSQLSISTLAKIANALSVSYTISSFGLTH